MHRFFMQALAAFKQNEQESGSGTVVEARPIATRGSVPGTPPDAPTGVTSRPAIPPDEQ
ncbi:MAG: hypothetical protein HIU82_05975 [Proteobacteria bacterium]|nr:hypothetical protein [Pseudomonadota bacterium]